MITVDINNDPNFLASEKPDPRADSLLVFQENEENAIVNEYFKQICGISEAIDSVAVLEEIQEKLEANQNPDAGTLRIAQITVEHLCSSIKGVEYSGPSMESFAGNRQAALEGLGSWIAAFFKAIYNAIAALLDFMFGWLKPANRVKNSTNQKATVAAIKKEINDNNRKPSVDTINNRVFTAIDPFHKECSDKNLRFNLEISINCTGYLSSTISIFKGILEFIVKEYEEFAADGGEDRRAYYDEMAIAKNEEWNKLIEKLAPTRSYREHHEKRIEEILARHSLAGDAKNMYLYGPYVNGIGIVAYRHPSAKRNYNVYHFDTISPDDNEKVATGVYNAEMSNSYLNIVEMTELYNKTSDEMAADLGDLVGPLSKFKKALEKVQKRYEKDPKFRMGPMLHIGKTLVQQAASFQQAMTQVDQTGIQYTKAIALIAKLYEVK